MQTLGKDHREETGMNYFTGHHVHDNATDEEKAKKFYWICGGENAANLNYSDEKPSITLTFSPHEILHMRGRKGRDIGCKTCAKLWIKFNCLVNWCDECNNHGCLWRKNFESLGFFKD